MPEHSDDEEFDDDRDFMKEFRARRMAEMKAAMARNRFGELRQINEPEYVSEVTNAGPGVHVVLLLFQPGYVLCRLVEQQMTSLARKFPNVKFLKIISTECIHNYPDANLPTLLIYHEGKILKQVVGLATLGGQDAKVEDLEWMLAQEGVVETEMEQNPRKGRNTGVSFRFK
eukprot:gnl/Trimastix_PCT/3341.p1 GENE.gnl/Trimastix_PCT/3341~~gnl/Trimastix_PCT/3341.p1  ORF type:complete len:172 (+),score=57.59 gnl/Trimastix_PCT/3341:218-733(+)